MDLASDAAVIAMVVDTPSAAKQKRHFHLERKQLGLTQKSPMKVELRLHLGSGTQAFTVESARRPTEARLSGVLHARGGNVASTHSDCDLVR
jgi:hypothetical protein